LQSDRPKVTVIDRSRPKPLEGAPGTEAIDHLIHSNRSWGEYLRHFATKRDAVAYVAQRLSELHAAPAAGTCELCGCESETVLVAYVWQYQAASIGFSNFAMMGISLLLGEIPLSARTEYMRFVTHHSVCRRCAVRNRLRYAIGTPFQPIGPLLFFFGLIGCTAWAVIMGYNYFYDRRADWLDWLGLGALLSLTIGLALTRFVAWLRVPAILRRRIRPPFELHFARRMDPG
jgi:hypothetical protein